MPGLIDTMDMDSVADVDAVAMALDERKRIGRRYWWLHVLLPSVSLSLIVVGLSMSSGVLTELGFAGYAAMFVAIGVLAIGERRVIHWNRLVTNRVVLESYRGVAAIPLGLACCIAGAALLVPVLAHAAGVSFDAMRSLVLARPCLALLPVGSTMALAGIGVVIGFAGHRDRGKGPLFNALLGAPSRLGGLIVLAWGVACLAVGGFELLLPDAFDRTLLAIFR